MSRIDNERTIAKFKQMEELYMFPKKSEVSKRVGINNTVLSEFLNHRRDLSYENKKKLNQWLDAKLELVKETV